MEINPNSLPHTSMYKFMIGSILPRPIGWISTMNTEGQPNLAPYSFFNAVCAKPPTVLFCPGVRGVDGNQKDTMRNIRENGEFVVNIVTAKLAEAMVKTATELPQTINEFEYAGLKTAPSVVVKPPRVLESPIHFECKVTHMIEISDQPGGGSVVIGEVVHLHVHESVLIGKDKIDLEQLQPVGRLAGASYAQVREVFDIMREPSQITPASE